MHLAELLQLRLCYISMHGYPRMCNHPYAHVRLSTLSLSSSDNTKMVQAVQVLWEGKEELMPMVKAPGIFIASLYPYICQFKEGQQV